MPLNKQMLWWGRFDPAYSRNGVLRQHLAALGWRVADFHPQLCALGDLEAAVRRVPKPDAVWVPCFRQRDVAAARRWCDRRGVPLIFDPLISAYDKQVWERFKLKDRSGAARRLLAWERALFAKADLVLADTDGHARFFSETLGARPERVRVVYVGADETLFAPEAEPAGDERARRSRATAAEPAGTERARSNAAAEPVEALFYGSFIPLHGAETIVEAARLYQGPPLRWCLLGAGPSKPACERAAAGLANVAFEEPVPYAQLPARIRRADILLGVFGTTQKAGRVIPNKVYQALACGRPAVTRESAAYPAEARASEAFAFVPAGDAQALASAVAAWAAERAQLEARGQAARAVYEACFSAAVVRRQLEDLLAVL